MNFDRNTVIGFVVLAALFFGYFYFTNKQQATYQQKKAAEKHYNDSLAQTNNPKPDSVALAKDSLHTDSVSRITSAGNFSNAANGDETVITAENSLMKVSFTSKGGQVKSVELKNYKEPDSSLVKLAGTGFDRLGYIINTASNQTANTADLYFSKIDSSVNTDGSKVYSFALSSTDSAYSSSVEHRFTIRPDDYMIDADVVLAGADKLLTQGTLNLTWQYAARQQESDIAYEKQNTQVGYVEDGEFDYHTIGRKSSKSFDEEVSWLGVRQRFFFGLVQAKNKFSSGRIAWEIPADTAKTVVQSTAHMKLQAPAGNTATIPLGIYYGPSDYHILKKYDQKFEKLVNLGQGIYAFVRPINKYIILPIFDFFQKMTPNMGLVIALLTIVIRLLTSPLIYKSYLSGAKMKALRPEIAKLREKHGGDQQAMSMEQMKLFREAGVNPLGGCIPALLQIPIFFALFSFFNSEVALRGAEFLWSSDLSAFDAPIKFGFTIPLFGSHLSLFNVAAVITSFLISWYSMSMTPDQGNPIMKYLPYIFPVFLLFFFNKLPSALTWYYTVSNFITLIMQIVIQKYIIDHEKILAQIEENRKKPKSKSKWQERLEQMQEQQKKMKEVQQKGKR